MTRRLPVAQNSPPPPTGRGHGPEEGSALTLGDRGTTMEQDRQGCQMKVTYDPEVDAAYLSFKKGPVEVTTIRLTEDVAADLGPHEEIVGIEVLDASEHLGFSGQKPEIELENLQVMGAPR